MGDLIERLEAHAALWRRSEDATDELLREAAEALTQAEADLASARKALENLRLYQQEIAVIGVEKESPRLMNLAEAIHHEIKTVAAREALRASTIGEEGEGKNSSSQDFATTDDGGDHSSLRSEATAFAELRAALRDLVSWAKVTPPSHRPHGLIARAEEALR